MFQWILKTKLNNILFRKPFLDSPKQPKPELDAKDQGLGLGWGKERFPRVELASLSGSGKCRVSLKKGLFFFFPFRATPAAYGGPGARG